VLVEGAANGHAILDQLRHEIAGVIEVKPDGGKVARAASVQAIVESGAVVLPASASWVEAWLDEVCAFPAVKHDDQTDAMVYALRDLQAGKSWATALRDARVRWQLGLQREPVAEPVAVSRCQHRWLDAGSGTRCVVCCAAPGDDERPNWRR
jgi:hypothetical protein